MSAKIERMVIATAILTAFALVCTTALLKSGEALPHSTPPVQVGTFQRRTLMFGGQLREYDVLYPSAALEDTRLLVVFALHCYGCDITTVRKMQPAIVMAQRQLSAWADALPRAIRAVVPLRSGYPCGVPQFVECTLLLWGCPYPKSGRRRLPRRY